MEETLFLAIDPDPELVLAAVESSDDLGKILRIHLMIEGLTEKLLREHSRAKVDGRTTFWAKVNLMRAMGVPEKLCAACEALGSLRNQFAHNPSATLASAAAKPDAFLAAVEAFAPILPKAHGSYVRKKSGAEYKLVFETASPAERVILAAGFLSGALGGLPNMVEFGERRQKAAVAGFML